MQIHSIHTLVKQMTMAVMAAFVFPAFLAKAEKKTDLFQTNDAYQLAVRKISRLPNQKPSDMIALTWIERVAAINVTCTNRAPLSCKQLLGFAATDNALLVRDHALRRIGQSAFFSWKEKRQLADQVIADDRNYRAGSPLWIVSTAQNLIRSNP